MQPLKKGAQVKRRKMKVKEESKETMICSIWQVPIIQIRQAANLSKDHPGKWMSSQAPPIDPGK